MQEKIFFTYIATNKRDTVLYTGVTSDIYQRMDQHKKKVIRGFTEKYNVGKLVFCEAFSTPLDAIAAEKRIKGWTRAKKIKLIEEKNPEWKDLLDVERDSSLRSE